MTRSQIKVYQYYACVIFLPPCRCLGTPWKKMLIFFKVLILLYLCSIYLYPDISMLKYIVLPSISNPFLNPECLIPSFHSSRLVLINSFAFFPCLQLLITLQPTGMTPPIPTLAPKVFCPGPIVTYVILNSLNISISCIR